MKYLSPEMQIEEVEDDDIVTLSDAGVAADETETTESENNVGSTPVSGEW